MKIAVVGSYGVGMTMRVARVPAAGETVSSGSYAAGPGGKGSNQAITAARLGAEVTFLTAVGPDVPGQEARELWVREDVDASSVITASKATMVAFILVDQSGENRIIIAAGALDQLTEAHVEGFRRSIREADMLVVSMEVPMKAVVAALRIGQEEGTRTLLNPAPASPLPDEVWELVDVITPNETEAPLVLGLDATHGLAPEDLMAALREKTTASIVLTLGSQGSLVNDGAATTAVPPIPANHVIDTTGAGDSFTAALAVALVEGMPLIDAASFAAAAGSHAVTVEGVINALPTRADVQNLIRTHR